MKKILSIITCFAALSGVFFSASAQAPTQYEKELMRKGMTLMVRPYKETKSYYANGRYMEELGKGCYDYVDGNRIECYVCPFGNDNGITKLSISIQINDSKYLALNIKYGDMRLTKEYNKEIKMTSGDVFKGTVYRFKRYVSDYERVIIFMNDGETVALKNPLSCSKDDLLLFKTDVFYKRLKEKIDGYEAMGWFEKVETHC